MDEGFTGKFHNFTWSRLFFQISYNIVKHGLHVWIFLGFARCLHLSMEMCGAGQQLAHQLPALLLASRAAGGMDDDGGDIGSVASVIAGLELKIKNQAEDDSIAAW